MRLQRLSHEPRARRFYALLVFTLACAQYISTIPYDYAWDDKLAITANDYTKRGIKGLPDIFSKRVSIPYKSEYRPLPQALHAVEYQLFHGSPHAGHAFNILWYAFSCVMVYAFVRFAFPRADPLYAFLVALLFTVHPLHVEVVANIKSRDEILALLFGLGAIILLVKALEQGRWALAAAGTLCVLAACLSKSNAVTLLPLAPLVAWYRSSDSKVSRRLAVACGMLLLCCVGLAVAIRDLQSAVPNDGTVHLNSTVLNNEFLWSAHTETIIPTALVIICRYLALFLYPHPLIHLYGYNQVPLNRWGDHMTWIVIAGLLSLAAVALRTWKQKLPLAFGLLVFAITYSVYSNLFFFAPDTMADRYMFLPSVGLAMLAVYAMFRLASLDLGNAVVNRSRPIVVMGLFVLVLGAYFARTMVGSRDWKNDSTLIHNRIRYMENNAAAQAIYAHQLNLESEEATSAELKQERKAAAMRAFARALQIYPDFQAAWIAIGRMFADQGIYDKAELSFIKAQQIEPLSPDSYYSLGTLYLAEQDTELAIPYLEKAVLLDPKMEDAFVMLGRAYLRADNIENLGALTATARQWFPENTDMEALRASYLFRTKQYKQAFELSREVMGRDPRNTLALSVLSSPIVQEFPTR